jgi:hypothetical protein
MKALISGIILLLAPLNLFGQLGKKLNEFTEKNISSIAIDRLGEFYLQFYDQSIKKYDIDGNYLCTFKLENDSITSLHPWNPLNVFVYERNKQTILFLDKALQPLNKKSIEPSLAIEPWLACAGNNNGNFWIYDKADHSLKKINIANETISLDIDLKKLYGQQTPNLVYVREYQNLLFLLDKKAGIKIISITGKLIESISSVRINNFSFMGEELYYLEENKLKFYNLYTKQQHSIEIGNDIAFALATDEKVVLIGNAGKVSIWEFKP